MLGGQVAVGGVQDVEADRALLAVGVDDDEWLRRVGEAFEDRVDEVALGVDDDRAAAGVGIVEHEPGDQRRLASAGGAEHVQVLAGVGDADRDRPLRAGVGDAQRLAPLAHAGRRGDATRARSRHAGNGRAAWKVRERGELGHRQQVGAATQPPFVSGGGRVAGVAAA